MLTSPTAKSLFSVVRIVFMTLFCLGCGPLLPVLAEPDEDPAVAAVPASPSAEDVAREVLQLQQQLGGSIVAERSALADWPQAPAPRHNRELAVPPAWRGPRHPGHPRYPSPSLSDVQLLRESAWRLDTTAHHLEQRNLYAQADALRALAERLRQDARALSAQSLPAP
jgi:hypothetical protein